MNKKLKWNIFFLVLINLCNSHFTLKNYDNSIIHTENENLSENDNEKSLGFMDEKFPKNDTYDINSQEETFENYNLELSSLISYSEDIVEAQMGYKLRHIVTVNVGTPPQPIKMKLSTAICGLWVLDKNIFNRGYEPEKSKSLIEMDIPGKVDFLRGVMIKDNIEFCKVRTEALPFVLVREIIDGHSIEPNIGGLIGFGYKCRSKSQGNINLHKIFRQAKGNKAGDVMSFKYNSETRKGVVTIAGFPGKLNVNSKRYRTIPIDKENTNGHWEVFLDSIYFEDGTLFKLEDKLSIGIAGHIFSVTGNVFDYILGRYFSKSIENHECDLNKNDVWEIICNIDFDKNKIGNIGIIVGKWRFLLNTKSLFVDTKINGELKSWFSIVHYPEHNEFYLAQTMLQGVNTIVYNKEKGEIGWYDLDY